jgi:hypothetical protein
MSTYIFILHRSHACHDGFDQFYVSCTDAEIKAGIIENVEKRTHTSGSIPLLRCHSDLAAMGRHSRPAPLPSPRPPHPLSPLLVSRHHPEESSSNSTN